MLDIFSFKRKSLGSDPSTGSAKRRKVEPELVAPLPSPQQLTDMRMPQSNAFASNTGPSNDTRRRQWARSQTNSTVPDTQSSTDSNQSPRDLSQQFGAATSSYSELPKPARKLAFTQLGYTQDAYRSSPSWSRASVCIPAAPVSSSSPSAQVGGTSFTLVSARASTARLSKPTASSDLSAKTMPYAADSMRLGSLSKVKLNVPPEIVISSSQSTSSPLSQSSSSSVPAAVTTPTIAGKQLPDSRKIILPEPTFSSRTRVAVDKPYSGPPPSLQNWNKINLPKLSRKSPPVDRNNTLSHIDSAQPGFLCQQLSEGKGRAYSQSTKLSATPIWPPRPLTYSYAGSQPVTDTYGRKSPVSPALSDSAKSSWAQGSSYISPNQYGRSYDQQPALSLPNSSSYRSYNTKNEALVHINNNPLTGPEEKICHESPPENMDPYWSGRRPQGSRSSPSQPLASDAVPVSVPLTSSRYRPEPIRPRRSTESLPTDSQINFGACRSLASLAPSSQQKESESLSPSGARSTEDLYPAPAVAIDPCSKCGIRASVLVEHAKAKEELFVKKAKWETYFTEDEAEKSRLQTQMKAVHDESKRLQAKQAEQEKELKTVKQHLEAEQQNSSELRKELGLLKRKLKRSKSVTENILGSSLENRIAASLESIVASSPPATTNESVRSVSVTSIEKEVDTAANDGEKNLFNGDLERHEKYPFAEILSFGEQHQRKEIGTVAIRQSMKFVARSPFPDITSDDAGIPSREFPVRPGRKSRPRLLFNGSNIKSTHVQRTGRLGNWNDNYHKGNDDPLGFMPKNVVPVLKDGSLAFREGLVDPRTRRLKRGVPVFKVGRRSQGDFL
ncbi:hypothetical protein V1512DRAFT_245898 [Lipomyces arxii]|uniref:uncharacterized protein n=1 Tax=Lipomyces arxii TaxID=56418 RepID=UPI0034CD232D